MNVEPDCRRACESRLNWFLLLPGVTAVIARISPFRGLIEMTAAAGSPRSYSTSRIALCAGVLEARIDRRVDLEAARAHAGHAVLGDQLVADIAEEVRLADRLVELAGLQAERALRRPVVLLPVDVSLPSIARSTWFRRAVAISVLLNGS